MMSQRCSSGDGNRETCLFPMTNPFPPARGMNGSFCCLFVSSGFGRVTAVRLVVGNWALVRTSVEVVGRLMPVYRGCRVDHVVYSWVLACRAQLCEPMLLRILMRVLPCVTLLAAFSFPPPPPLTYRRQYLFFQ